MWELVPMKNYRIHIGPGTFLNWTRDQTLTRIRQAFREMESMFAVTFQEVGTPGRADVRIEFRPKTSLPAGRDANGVPLFNLAEMNASGLLEINRERPLVYESREAPGLIIHEIGGHWLMKSLYSNDRHVADPTSIMNENLTVYYFSPGDARLWQSKLGWSGKQFGVVTKQESTARRLALEATRASLIAKRKAEMDPFKRQQLTNQVLANLAEIQKEVAVWRRLNDQWKTVQGAL
jgi:hypothetical protein